MKSSIAAVVALVSCVSGCVVELRGGAAQDACSDLTASFCERLADCEGSVDLDACIAADDALGGPCADAEEVELESDLETCKEALTDMSCVEIEDRTSPTFDLPCVQDIRFAE